MTPPTEPDRRPHGDADPDDVHTPSGARLPSGPGGTAGLPGENSADGGGLDVDELDDTTLGAGVAPPHEPDVR